VSSFWKIDLPGLSLRPPQFVGRSAGTPASAWLNTPTICFPLNWLKGASKRGFDLARGQNRLTFANPLQTLDLGHGAVEISAKLTVTVMFCGSLKYANYRFRVV